MSNTKQHTMTRFPMFTTRTKNRPSYSVIFYTSASQFQTLQWFGWHLFIRDLWMAKLVQRVVGGDAITYGCTTRTQSKNAK